MNQPPVKDGPPMNQDIRAPRVLLIEDSSHFQNLVTMLVKQKFPAVDLHVANDGISGLVSFGHLQPDLIIVDILLPGIDGATLITSLRSRIRTAPASAPTPARDASTQKSTRCQNHGSMRKASCAPAWFHTPLGLAAVTSKR